ncbi:MAG: hypothetical protein PUC44_05965 [Eubacteriales bacterium]|nr:hypothetical protein [Eubacteriales bacterium]
MNILILTSKLDPDNFRTAENAKKQILRSDPNSSVTVQDFFSALFPVASRRLYPSLHAASRKHPDFCRVLSDSTALRAPLIIREAPYFILSIGDLIQKSRADIILSTCSAASQYVSIYKKRTGDSVPLVSCVTESAQTSKWILAETDAYLAEGEDAKKRLLKSGVSEEKIFSGGLPVEAALLQSGRSSHCCHFESISGEYTSVRNVLILGSDSVYFSQIDRLLTILFENGIHAVVLTGRNRKLCRELHYRHPEASLVGNVHEVSDYFITADVIIAPAAESNLVKAICAGRPFFALCPRNRILKSHAAYIEQEEIGSVLKRNTAHNMQRFIREIKDPMRHSYECRNMERLRKEYNPSELYRVLLFVSSHSQERAIRISHNMKTPSAGLWEAPVGTFR